MGRRGVGTLRFRDYGREVSVGGFRRAREGARYFTSPFFKWSMSMCMPSGDEG